MFYLLGSCPRTLPAISNSECAGRPALSSLFFHTNPCTVPGLTLAQRIDDYMGAVHYFLFGLPRIVCLIAPLPWLYFGIPVLRADFVMLIVLFFSYFIASLASLHTVSKGMRSALWSDIYETTLCFAITRAVFGTVLTPRKERPFVVTPKGEQMARTPILNRLVRPHLILFGLLLVGIVVSLSRETAGDSSQDLALSLFWAGVNLLLLGAAITTAHETPQRQQYVRVPIRLACELMIGDRRVGGQSVDMSENGMLVEIAEPIEAPDDGLTIRLPQNSGEWMSLRGWVVRQEVRKDRCCQVGLRFDQVPNELRHALIRMMFSTHTAWPDTEQAGPGPWSNLQGIVRGIVSAYKPLKPSRRRVPRIPCRETCQLFIGEDPVTGTLRDISFSGLSFWTADRHRLSEGIAFLDLDSIRLKIRPRRSVSYKEGTLYMCSVESVEQGESKWAALIHESWNRAGTYV